MSHSLRRVLSRNYAESLRRAFPLDWSATREYRLPGVALGPYYIEWQPGGGPYGEHWSDSQTDDAGTLLTGVARAYHPIRIAQFGLHRHACWSATRAEADRIAYLAQARWLAENARVRNGVPGCLIFDFPWPKYGVRAGWISAMAQGEAVSLLLRAALGEDDERFKSAALLVAQPFRFGIGDGGVTYRSKRGDVFFEEVATSPAAHILNGHIFAMWGVLELATASNEGWLVELAGDTLQTLRRRLELYDAGYWSYYSLLGTRSGFRSVALLKYHAFHIAQLRVTAALTGDPYFSAVADRWQGYTASGSCRRRVLANTAAGLIPGVLKSDHAGQGVDLLERLSGQAAPADAR